MSRTSRSKGFALVAVAGAAALVLSACGSSDNSSSSSSTPATTSAAAASAATSSEAMTSEASSSEAMTSASGSETGASGSGSETSSAAGSLVGSDDDYCDVIKKNWPDISGKTVTVYTGISGVEADGLKTSFKAFEDCSGAKVELNSDKNFETQIVVQAKSGSAPDIGFVPQPGLLQTLVSTGTVKEAPALVAQNTEKYWDPGWKTYGTVDGKFYAAPLGANVKSLVWYSPKTFKANGWAVPTTWDDLLKLSDTIAATGKKPWCAGAESGAATGWPLTDWLEEVVHASGRPGRLRQVDQRRRQVHRRHRSRTRWPRSARS